MKAYVKLQEEIVRAVGQDFTYCRYRIRHSFEACIL